MSDRKSFTENQKQIIFKSCDFFKHSCKKHIFAANAFAIKQDVERAFGNNKRPTLFLSN
jgi:hypothetical protein